MSNTEDLIERLTFLLQENRRVTFITGSGISLGSVPGTHEMTQRFLDACPKNTVVDSHDDGSRYRDAAERLRRTRGDRKVADVIRTACLSAYRGDANPSPATTDSSEWAITPEQTALARFIQLIPTDLRGPVLTTNFDPLTELALESVGITNYALTLSPTSPPNLSSIRGGLPVVHLHGSWDSPATLNTPGQLALEQPDVSQLIRDTLRDSTVIAVGYGGWDDIFTRTLRDMIDHGDLASLGSEVIWIAHEDQLRDGTLPKRIGHHPGVVIYTGTRAVDVLEGATMSLADIALEKLPSLPGWHPILRSLRSDLGVQREAYLRGAQPTAAIADLMPRLKTQERARTAVQESLMFNGDSLVFLLGPTGEGKSTALLQAAIDLTQQNSSPNGEELAVLVRKPGAATIDQQWIAEVRERFEKCLLVVDEADLMIDQLISAYATYEPTASTGQIHWLLAMHDSRGSQIGKINTTGVSITTVPVSGITRSDAGLLAEAWLDSPALDMSLHQFSTAELTERIYNKATIEASIPDRPCLFGAVLDLWGSADLNSRATDLLDRLERLPGSRPFAELFRSIAAIQSLTAHSRYPGMHVDVLSRLAQMTTDEVDDLIVRPIGREVGISRVGNRILVRHPAIAHAILGQMKLTGSAANTVKRISEVGGQLRQERWSPFSYRTAYRLCDHLRDDVHLAFAAASGAALGASRLLEPRVTMLKYYRGIDPAQAATVAANYLNGSYRYDDRYSMVRGLFVERAVCEREAQHPHKSLGFAAAALCDIPDAGPITQDNIEYALTVIMNLARRLSTRPRDKYDRLADASSALEEQLTHPAPRTMSRVLNEFKEASSEWGRETAQPWTFESLNVFLRNLKLEWSSQLRQGTYGTPS